MVSTLDLFGIPEQNCDIQKKEMCMVYENRNIINTSFKTIKMLKWDYTVTSFCLNSALIHAQLNTVPFAVKTDNAE